MADKDSNGETNAVRLSFRTTASNHDKIVDIAKEKGWLNAQGKPNVSAVLNFIIDAFEVPRKRSRRKRRG